MPALGSDDSDLLVICRSGAIIQSLHWGQIIDICL